MRSNTKSSPITPRQQHFLLQYRESLCNKAKACRKAGISRQTLYLWMKNDKDFLKAMRDNEFEDSESAEQVLRMKALLGNDMAALKFFLKHKHPDYRDVSRMKKKSHDMTTKKGQSDPTLMRLQYWMERLT